MAVITALDLGATARRDRGLGEVEARLGHADQLHRLGGGHGGRQRGRVGEPDVLARADHQPAGDEARVLARLDHPGEVVQRGVDVGAADRLDEGADHVVVLVALAVVAHGGLVDGGLGGREVDGVEPVARGGTGRGLEVGQRPARVAAGQAYEVGAGVVVELDRRRPGRARR